MLVSLAFSRAFAQDNTFERALEAKKQGKLNIAQALLMDLVRTEPRNAYFLYHLGMVYAFQKEYEQSILSLQQALQLAPDDQDIRAAAANVYAWKGDYPKALKHTALLKNDVEAKRLKARIYFYQSNYQQAKVLLKPLSAAYPERKDILQQLAQVEAAEQQSMMDQISTGGGTTADDKKWLVAIGVEKSSFDRSNVPYWKQSFLQLTHPFNDNLSAHLKLEQAQRNHIENTAVQTGGTLRFSQNYSMYGLIRLSENGTFFSKQRLKVGGSARVLSDHDWFGDAWLTLDVQHDRYSNDLIINTITPGIRYNVTRRITLHVKQTHTIDRDQHLRGWSIRSDWFTPVESLNINAILSESSEQEKNTIIHKKARGLGMSFNPHSDVRFYLSYTQEEWQNTYIRRRKILASSFLFKF